MSGSRRHQKKYRRLTRWGKTPNIEAYHKEMNEFHNDKVTDEQLIEIGHLEGTPKIPWVKKGKWYYKTVGDTTFINRHKPDREF